MSRTSASLEAVVALEDAVADQLTGELSIVIRETLTAEGLAVSNEELPEFELIVDPLIVSGFDVDSFSPVIQRLVVAVNWQEPVSASISDRSAAVLRETLTARGYHDFWVEVSGPTYPSYSILKSVTNNAPLRNHDSGTPDLTSATFMIALSMVVVLGVALRWSMRRPEKRVGSDSRLHQGDPLVSDEQLTYQSLDVLNVANKAPEAAKELMVLPFEDMLAQLRTLPIDQRQARLATLPVHKSIRLRLEKALAHQ